MAFPAVGMLGFSPWTDADDDPTPLVRSARAGDRAAFARLHARYGRMIHGVLLARVSAPDAEDLVQDVFVVALERIADLRDDRAFGAWLATIARRRAADHLDARRGEVALADAHGDAPRYGRDRSAEDTARDTGLAVGSDRRAYRGSPHDALEAERALTALRALPETYRETLTMRLVEGMTGPEISVQTGLSPGSVRVNLHRGMKLLRAALRGPGGPAGKAEAGPTRGEGMDDDG